MEGLRFFIFPRGPPHPTPPHPNPNPPHTPTKHISVFVFSVVVWGGLEVQKLRGGIIRVGMGRVANYLVTGDARKTISIIVLSCNTSKSVLALSH